MFFKKKFIQYISSERRFSEHTIQSYQTDLQQFLNYLDSEFDIQELDKVNFQIIRTWIVSLLENGISPRSVKRKISTLKSYFRFLIRDSIIKENPMSRIIAPKSTTKLPVFMPQNEIENLLNKLQFEDNFLGKRNKLIIELFYVTGIRLSELINIQVKDIDFINESIKIFGKRNKERIIPLSKNMAHAIQEFISSHNLQHFLFTNNDAKKLYTKLVYRVVNKYIGEISSISKKSPHILRHTFATHMLNNGADINAIKDLLGHANLSATQVYTHNTIEKIKSVYNQAHPRA